MPPSPTASKASARSPRPSRGLTYADSGVNLEEKDLFTESLDSLMRRTHGPRVIRNPGGFAGLFRLDFNQKLFAKNYKDPVLVACTDGVGTKVKLATQTGLYDTLGIDLVAMSINDMLVQGAEPLFFLDYIAVPKVEHTMLTALLRGVVEGCRQSGCALLGGETAEMPSVYAPGEFDMAGFAVGVVELARAVDPVRVKPNDVVIGLSSSGIHSNGYSLVRRIVEAAGLHLNEVYDELVLPANGKKRRAAANGGRNGSGKKSTKKATAAGSGGGGPDSGGGLAPTLGRVLMTPTRIYAASIVKLLREYRVKKVVSGMAHITGSGLSGNLCRALPQECDAIIDRASWDVPPVFQFLQKHGRVDEEEMRRVFNMGIGYCLIVRPTFADSIVERLTKLGESARVIGKIVKGRGEVKEK
jgi:phosphoribosylformylglycinamidine cyclo-ligase